MILRKPTFADYALLLALVLIWASAFLAIKVAVPETGPVWLATIRVLIGFAVLLPFALLRGWQWPDGARQWRFLLAIAFLNVALPFFLISWAELTITAGIASLLMGVGPLFALIASHLFTDDDKFTPLKLLAVMVGFSGILLVVGGDALRGLGGNLLPQLAALGGSACYVASGILIRKLGNFPPVRLSCLVLMMSSALLLVPALLFVDMPDFSSISGKTWLLLLYLGLFPTGIAYVLRYRLIQAIGMSAFSLGLNLIPVAGVFMGAVLLGETVSTSILIALGLVVLALFLARLSK